MEYICLLKKKIRGLHTALWCWGWMNHWTWCVWTLSSWCLEISELMIMECFVCLFELIKINSYFQEAQLVTGDGRRLVRWLKVKHLLSLCTHVFCPFEGYFRFTASKCIRVQHNHRRTAGSSSSSLWSHTPSDWVAFPLSVSLHCMILL